MTRERRHCGRAMKLIVAAEGVLVHRCACGKEIYANRATVTLRRASA